MEGDLDRRYDFCSGIPFQSTPSAWRETDSGWVAVSNFSVFQSTPSAWRETDRDVITGFQIAISIHSLRMEGDAGSLSCRFSAGSISIHSLRMEGDWLYTWHSSGCVIFQSTPSAWRETHFLFFISCKKIHFNPLPPHGGRPGSYSHKHDGKHISIHSLRMEGDVNWIGEFFCTIKFQSTPPAWRETCGGGSECNGNVLFQSTPSAWRETDVLMLVKPSIRIFQSTPSAWRETCCKICDGWH